MPAAARRPSSLLLALASCVAVLLVLAPGEASAQAEFDYRGLIESDLRLALPAFPGGDQPEDVPDVYFARTDNTARLTAALTYGQVRGVIDLALTFTGRGEVDPFTDLHERRQVDPWYFESDALYLEVRDLFADGIDLRLGRQIVEWGKADVFNPTSVINPYDLEDPLDFGRKIANEMVVLSISPPWTVEGEEIPILDELNWTLVAVPVFRSQLLPHSARLAFTSPRQFARFVHSDTLNNFIEVQEAYLRYGDVNYDLRIEEPSVDIENIQLGTSLGLSLFGVDLQAIYYWGFDHNVQPAAVEVGALVTAAGTEVPFPADLSNPQVLINLINTLGEAGTLDGSSIDTKIRLDYPRVHVVGGSIATSLDFLGGLGLWAEFAGVFHDGVYFTLEVGGNDQPRETQVEPGFFWKLTTGMDYSITSWWYVNVQYLHGFVDEFGAENLGDYIVAGMDFKALSEQLMLRLFSITELAADPDEASAILYPALSFRFWQNTELIAGSLLHFGNADTKFGNRVTGPNLAFIKGKYAF